MVRADTVVTTLSVRRLWKEYDGHVVLENVNLEVKDNEFITVVGASGCGKTTFLRMLLGEERSTQGTFLMDGRPLPDEPGPDRGVVFQHYSVFPHLTVLQNVLLGLELAAAPRLGKLYGAPRRRALTQVEQMLHTVGLHEARSKYPHMLSGGMQQRLSIAQSVITNPKILLLDEPFAALDPGLSADMHELILRLWEEHKMNIFMVTHDLKEGFELGTRLLVFDKVRLDPQAPERFGATITYDIPLGGAGKKLLKEVSATTARTGEFAQKVADNVNVTAVRPRVEAGNSRVASARNELVDDNV